MKARVPTPNEDGVRRYGNLGRAEDSSRCIMEVSYGPAMKAQCARRRGFGPDGSLCMKHANTTPRVLAKET